MALFKPSNPQPIGFSGILLAKRQNSFYCTYFLQMCIRDRVSASSIMIWNSSPIPVTTRRVNRAVITRPMMFFHLLILRPYESRTWCWSLILYVVLRDGKTSSAVSYTHLETNLHPQWVVELAHLLVRINKTFGTKILITSHNPDMVSACLLYTSGRNRSA